MHGRAAETSTHAPGRLRLFASRGYFVTLCAVDRKCLFGEIVDDEMRLNQIGTVVASCWGEIPKRFPNVTLDEFVVMPNHLHGILLLGDAVAGHARPLTVIVGSFKSAVSRFPGLAT